MLPLRFSPFLALALVACGSDSDQTTPQAGPTGPALGFAGPNPACIEERLGALAFRIELAEAVSRTVEVPFAIGGTATETDFQVLTSSPLVLPAGETQAFLRIAFPDDGAFEVDETVVLTLLEPTGAVLGAQDRHTVTIKHFEIEPNDNVPQAMSIGTVGQVFPGFGVDLHGSYTEADGDIDAFRFEAAVDSMVQVELELENPATDGMIWFANESGMVTQMVDDAGPGATELALQSVGAGVTFHVVLLFTGPDTDYSVRVRGLLPALDPPGAGQGGGTPGLDLPLAWTADWATLRDAWGAKKYGTPFAPRTVERLRIERIDADGTWRGLEIETQLVD